MIMAKITFKSETSQQKVLFPSYIGDLIPENHPVRLVNKVVDDRVVQGEGRDLQSMEETHGIEYASFKAYHSDLTGS